MSEWSAGDIIALIGLIVTVLGFVGGGIVWLLSHAKEHGSISFKNDAVDKNIEELKSEMKELSDAVDRLKESGRNNELENKAIHDKINGDIVKVAMYVKALAAHLNEQINRQK